MLFRSSDWDITKYSLTYPQIQRLCCHKNVGFMIIGMIICSSCLGHGNIPHGFIFTCKGGYITYLISVLNHMRGLACTIVSTLVSISALELVKRSVAIRSMAPICLLLGVEMAALTCLFSSGAKPMSHSDSFFFRILLGALRPNCSLAVLVSSPS